MGRVGSGRDQKTEDISGSGGVGSRFPWVGSGLDPRATLIHQHSGSEFRFFTNRGASLLFGQLGWQRQTAPSFRRLRAKYSK